MTARSVLGLKKLETMTENSKQKKYSATVKVIRYYEIGFESPNFKQALLDAETIIEDENFKDDFDKEERKLVGVRHDDS